MENHLFLLKYKWITSFFYKLHCQIVQLLVVDYSGIIGHAIMFLTT